MKPVIAPCLSRAAARLCAAVLLCAALLGALPPPGAWAQDPPTRTVTLRQGALTLSGEILGYDGTYLRLATDVGEVTLNYSTATCEGAYCPKPEDYVPTLRLSGAPLMADVLLPALIQGYARAQGLRAVRRDIDDLNFEYDIEERDTGAPRLRFRFRVGSSDEAFADLLSHQTDVALSVREIRADEAARAYDIGLGRLVEPRRSEIVALSALVPIASPRRRPMAISMAQLAAVFGGEITDWAQLGQAPGAITLHLLEPHQGHSQDFMDRVMAPSKQSLADHVVRHSTMAALSTAVTEDMNALGIASFTALGGAQPLPIGGACGMLAQADLTTLKTEDYPLTQPLFMYLPQRRMPPEAARWVAWMRTAQAQRVVQRSGFVDRGAVPIPLAQQGDRLVRAIQIAGSEITLADLQTTLERLAGKSRLSITFRFTPGSTRLDAQSRSNMLQLGRQIRDGGFDGARLVLVGFSDGKGPASANRTLSLARAESVRRALLKALGGALPDTVSLQIDAFGEALPLACDDSDWGRQTNRRVELWVQRALE